MTELFFHKDAYRMLGRKKPESSRQRRARDAAAFNAAREIADAKREVMAQIDAEIDRNDEFRALRDDRERLARVRRFVPRLAQR